MRRCRGVVLLVASESAVVGGSGGWVAKSRIAKFIFACWAALQIDRLKRERVL